MKKFIGTRIFFPEEFITTRRKFKLLLKKDIRIPKEIREKRGLEIYYIKELIKKYVEVNKNK